MDLLARADPSHTLAQVAGPHRRAMGQAWQLTAERRAKRSAKAAHTQFFLRDDHLRRTRYPAWGYLAKRPALLLSQLPPLPRIHAPDRDRGNARCSGSYRGPTGSTARSFWEQLLE